MSGRITAVTMPKWGIEMVEGTIVRWVAAPDETVGKGDPLLEVETEKIVNTVDAPAAGVLRRVLAKDGDIRSVGSLIGVLSGEDVPEADVERFIGGFKAATVSFEPDLEPAVANVALSPGESRTKLSATRVTIGRRLQQSAQSIPHYRLAVDVEADEAIKLKQRYTQPGSVRLTLNDIIVGATARTLMKHPALNSHLQEDEAVQFAHANVGIAMATDTGLLVPVIRQAECKSLSAIARESRDLASRARSGSLTQADVADATFTLSNLGMHGITRFDAIINPPQVGILAVGAALPRVIVRAGKPDIAHVITLTLSADHRVIDGAVGAKFLQSLKLLLESPADLEAIFASGSR